MGAPRKLTALLPVEVRYRQSVAGSLSLKAAWKEVTIFVKPAGRRNQTVTQVKVFSPETTIKGEDDTVHDVEVSIPARDKASATVLPRGLSPRYGIEGSL